MMRPLKSVVRSIRLTEEDNLRFESMIGFRRLWSFSDLVNAGLELLYQEQRSVANAAPVKLPPPEPPPTPQRRKKR